MQFTVPDSDRIDVSPPAPRASGGLGTRVVPLPKEPPAQTPAQAEADTIDVELKKEQLEEIRRKRAAEAAKEAAALARLPTARAELRRVIDKAREAQKLSREGYFATGFGSGIAGKFEATPARNVLSKLDTIGANIAFEELQKMRDESPTGGALGQVTERELELLQSTIASLDPGVSDTEFQANMDQIIRAYEDVLKKLPEPERKKILEGAEEEGAGTPVDNAEGAIPGAASDIPPPPDDSEADRTNPFAPPPGPVQAEISTETKLVEHPGMAKIAPQLGKMLAEGVPDRDILLFMRQSGIDPATTSIKPALDYRRTPDYQEWRRQNPGAAFEIDTRVEVPLEGLEKLHAQVADSRPAAALAGVADVVSRGTLDEVGAGAEAIGDALGGQNIVDAYNENVEGARERRNMLSGAYPGSYLLGQLAGGLAIPAGATTSPMQLAKVGAREGGLYGFGSADDQNFLNRLDEAAIGTGIGAAAGAGIGAGAKLLPSRSRPTDEALDIARAAEEEGVRVSRPMLDPSRRPRAAYLESTIGGGRPVREGMEATAADLETSAARLGEGGVPQEPGLMGQRVQDAMRRDLDRQRGEAGKLYDRAAELTPETPVYGREIVQELDTELAKLQRNPNTNRALINYLEGVRGDFVNEGGELLPKTIQDIRNIRTNLSAEINSRNLTRSNAERIISRALDKGRRDIDRDLLDAGPNGALAKDLYREADVRWRLAKRDEKQIAEKLIGPANSNITGKQAMDRAMQWINSGAEGRTQAARFWEKMSPQERLDFSATVASRYGRRAADEPFSPALFVSNTRTIPPSSRALLFGEEGARSIANLRTLSKAYDDMARSLNNSRSGQVINWGQEIKNMLTRGGVGGAAGTAVAGPMGGAIGAGVGAGASILAQKLSARSLMNPDLTKWLSLAPRQTTPQAVESHLDRLTKIAAKNPAIAQDALGLQRGLQQALGLGQQGATRVPVAASDAEEDPAP